jgi:hypothetical protein
MKLRSLPLIISLSLLSLSAFAANLPMYDQPQNNAKVTGTIDTSKGIMPIYTPQGDWVKIADPRNGNVGWVKKSDLTKATGTTFTVQYGTSSMTSAEAQEMVKKMQMDQQAVQQSINKAMQTMMDVWKNFPMIIPVMVAPQTPTPTTAPAPAAPVKPAK